MIGVIWKNCAIVWAVCFFGLLASAAAQPVDDLQAPAQPSQNAGTNQIPDEGFSTNVYMSLQPPVNPMYGAQPFPNLFEAQNNAPVVAGPSSLGSSQIGSPVMGTGVFGVPGYTPMSGPGVYQEGLLNVHAGLSYSFLYKGPESNPHLDSIPAPLTKWSLRISL